MSSGSRLKAYAVVVIAASATVLLTPTQARAWESGGCGVCTNAVNCPDIQSQNDACGRICDMAWSTGGCWAAGSYCQPGMTYVWFCSRTG